MSTARPLRRALVVFPWPLLLTALSAAGQSGCELVAGLAGDPILSPDDGVVSPDGGAPPPGTPVLIAEGQSQPRALAVSDDDLVFWANEGDQTLWRADLRAGAKPERVLSSAPQLIHALAIDVDHVYWSAFSDDHSACVGEASIGRVPRRAAPVDPAMLDIRWKERNCMEPLSVFVDGSDVYWTTAAAMSSIYKMPKGKVGTDITYINEQYGATSIWADSTQAYWSTRANDYPSGIQVTSRVTFDKAGIQSLADDADIVQLTGDATSIYWVTSSGKVRKHSKIADGTGATDLVDGGGEITSLSIDDKHVYYTVPSASMIRRVPIGGGEAETVVDAQNDPQRVVVDAKRIYWTTYAGGRVFWTTKP